VLILSNPIFNQKSGTVIATPITSQPQRAGFPLTYQLTTGTLPKEAWVKISQIRTLSTARLGAHLGRVESHEVNKIIEGLQEIMAE
jgi:mRNA interferase MazF